jgi:hypothetical protein
MAVKNSTILQRIWLDATNDFQQRIPEPTQTNIAATIDALFDPMNKNYYNYFIDALVMRIGGTYVHNQTWKNKLSVFKKKRLEYGNTIQEILPAWVKAHAYRDDYEDVFKMHRPDAAVVYHSVNRRDQYDITINDIELRTAFTDEYGLNQLVSGFLRAPYNSDEYDEYRIMMQLFAEYENRFGFYKEGLGGAVTTKQIGEDFLVNIRADAELLTFPSSRYSGIGAEEIPVFARPEELVIFMTPHVKANTDVRNLAAAFNRSDAEIRERIIVVDEFPVDGFEAVLTTEDFFVCQDTVYTTTSAYNPKTLGTNYYLTHHGIYSISPYVPAIAYTTGAAGTVTNLVSQTVTGINATISNNTPDAGDDVQITVTLAGSISPVTPPVKVVPNAATYSVGVTRGDDAVNSPRTRVDEYGVLHVANSLETGDVITVDITSTYINPSGATTEYTTSVTATVA